MISDDEIRRVTRVPHWEDTADRTDREGRRGWEWRGDTFYEAVARIKSKTWQETNGREGWVICR